MRFERRIVTTTERVKRKLIRKHITDYVPWLKFQVNRIESKKYFVEPIVNVNNMAF